MPPHKPLRILVVDDSEDKRYSIAIHLRRAGYHITEAETGEQALRQIPLGHDLVILDVKLPDMSGFEISRMIRSNPRTRHIPVLQISATYVQSGDKVSGLDAGADAYLAGPVEPEELLANVRTLLRLKEAQDALAATNQRLRSVLSNILDIFFALDSDLNFIELNPAAEKLFGRTSSELMGGNLFDFFPEARSSHAHHQFKRAVEERMATQFETESAVRPGTWWEVHLHPGDNRLDVYLRDITDRKLYEKKLYETAEQLTRHVQELELAQKELARARDQLSAQNELLEAKVRERTARLQETIDDLETFSYSITHDMRAPLRAMQGFAKLLLEGHAAKLDPDGQDYLQRICNSANRLDLLIRDVLSYSNIVRTPLTLVPVDADKLARDIISEYPGLKTPHAEVSISEKLPCLMANEAFLTQCFSNLLANAVKFVPPETIPRVDISVQRQEATVRINFKDNGIGISPNHQHRLFTLFHRAQNKYPGTGVGLAVVRKAVERMGGRVGFESAPGQGSTFWLELQEARP